MIDLSDRLQMIAGNLEPFQKSGLTLTAEETGWMLAQLRCCADAARQLHFDLCWAKRQLDEIVDDAADQARASAPMPPPRRPRRLRVIEGGRA